MPHFSKFMFISEEVRWRESRVKQQSLWVVFHPLQQVARAQHTKLKREYVCSWSFLSFTPFPHAVYARFEKCVGKAREIINQTEIFGPRNLKRRCLWEVEGQGFSQRKLREKGLWPAVMTPTEVSYRCVCGTNRNDRLGYWSKATLKHKTVTKLAKRGM